MVKQIGLLHHTKVLSVFLLLTHLFIFKADYTHFSKSLFNAYRSSSVDSHKECSKKYLEENNKTPIKCNNNYCNSFSSFFTASFSYFRLGKLMDRNIKDRFFLYDDPPYSSFFNSIWIPPKIKV
ncbi:hypothetical protein CEY12_04235 [Chryseobacterium sp. T16E-39]|uniref:hypothetical protein n=1 Tax=Chryseobacterium sp. T16E-39 TaxID=2015076 RepID=UPI000B5B2880|nr:hypothetical protein [Chryseobacterium sp. T16E-39]ASK29353.1 hypothetical protein CEY12_04235 [Chryseobacterium sp. T16E-39]